MFKMKISTLSVVVLGLALLAAITYRPSAPVQTMDDKMSQTAMLDQAAEKTPDLAVNPTLSPAAVADAVQPSPKATADNVKEFTMTSFFEVVDGKPKPQFTLSEIRVKKGDTVRLNVTNTKGMHDFVIDELNISRETPLNEQVTVEFTADKAGSFIYYCSKPNHRALGQWGTLIVE